MCTATTAMLSAVVALPTPSAANVSVKMRGWLGQVQATVGALWDAYAEIAVYIEVLRVEAGLPAPPNFKGGAWCLCFHGLGILNLILHNNLQRKGVFIADGSTRKHFCMFKPVMVPARTEVCMESGLCGRKCTGQLCHP